MKLTASELSSLGILSENNGAYCGNGSRLMDPNLTLFQSINPTKNEVIANVRSASLQQYETVIAYAQTAFKTWRQVPAPKRGALIYTMGEMLRAQKDQLGSLIALEMGKTKAEADGEVQEMIDMADMVVGQSRMLYGKTMHSERSHHRLYQQWHPLGVTGVITAFNFPVAVWAWNAFLAAICGNTVVWKPSSQTPLCAIAVQHLCDKAMKSLGYEGVFNCVISPDHLIADRLVNDLRIPLISFTGSTATGKTVGEKVAARFGRSILELGGNNAIIVDDTADLDLALRAILFGAVGTAGQRCTSTRRVYLQRSIADKVTQALLKAYQHIRCGDPLDPDTHMGPLINAQAVEHFEKAIQEITESGGKVLIGGKALPGPGFFVEPTLVSAPFDLEILKRETFAPILYLIQYDTLESAVAMQNNVVQGLSSALFTRSLLASEYYLSAVGSDCGIANINIGTSGAEIGGAFGGEKHTGGGREAGSDAWKAYMRRQTNTINWGMDLPLAQGIAFNLT